jgi:RNA polymerase I-specific transcription initiation factor RRN11
MWTTSLSIMSGGTSDGPPSSQRIEFLRDVMLQYPEERVSIIKELVLCLILSGRMRHALDELELYLPSFPFQDNPVLHIYAGLISLYIAQPANEGSNTGNFNTNLLRDAQSHFERAKALDPDNVVAHAFIERISALTQESNKVRDSDDDETAEEDSQKRKRIRA